MISARRSHSQGNRQLPRLALLPGTPWLWRLGSLLALALLAAVLLPRPGTALAASVKNAPKPALNVVVIGDFYSYGYASSADRALQRSTPPTLQALNQIQAANPGVTVNVLFIPVSQATNASLFHSARVSATATRPALIKAVRRASVVIIGVGGGNTGLAEAMRSALFGNSVPATTLGQLMAAFADGSFLQAQTALLDSVAANAAPGTTIVTLGYPTVLGEQLPTGFTWWSPFSGSMIGQQQANMSAQLISALNTANNQATRIAAAQHSGLHFLYADLSGALQGLGPLGGPQHGRPAMPAGKSSGSPAGDIQQTVIGSALVPYVDQAANNELAAQGLQGSQNIPPVTPKSGWKLSVVLPLPAPAAAHPKPPTSNAGANMPPPVYQAPPPAGMPGGPPYSGGAAGAPPASHQGGIWINLPLIPPVQLLPPGSAQSHGSQGQHPGQPGATGKPAGTDQPPGATPPSGVSGAGTGGTPASPPGSPQIPTVPAPPAPLPQPIGPQEPPGGAATGMPGSTAAGTAPAPGTTSAGAPGTTTPGTTTPGAPGTTMPGTPPASPGTATPGTPIGPSTPGASTPGTAPATPGAATPGAPSPGSPTTATPPSATGTNPGAAAPGTPGATAPTTPSTSGAATPGGGTPGGTAPSAPGGTGANPSGAQGTTAGATTPGTTTPSASGTTTPSASGATTPSTPGATTPSTPGTTTPGAPAATTPGAPAATTPSASAATTPSASGATTPSASGATTTPSAGTAAGGAATGRATATAAAAPASASATTPGSATSAAGNTETPPASTAGSGSS